MPSPTIVYAGTDVEKIEKAMRDVKSYLGDNYGKVRAMILNEKDCTAKQIAHSLSLFLGIHGFPAQVFADSIIAERDGNARLTETA